MKCISADLKQTVIWGLEPTYQFQFLLNVSKILLGYQSCQMVKTRQHFRDHLRPPHQGDIRRPDDGDRDGP
jgi:hypothetical protein